jgi:hypothetical protein
VSVDDAGVQRREEAVGTRLRDSQSVDGNPIYIRVSRRVRVRPVDVADGTACKNLDSMPSSSQPCRELSTVEFGASGHLVAVPLGDKENSHDYRTLSR